MQNKPLYRTARGQAYVGDSLELLAGLPDDSIDLVMTSPPFALRRQKTYGNVEETEYVQWIKPFGQEVFRVLKESGSFVLDLGGHTVLVCHPVLCITSAYSWLFATRSGFTLLRISTGSILQSCRRQLNG